MSWREEECWCCEKRDLVTKFVKVEDGWDTKYVCITCYPDFERATKEVDKAMGKLF